MACNKIVICGTEKYDSIFYCHQRKSIVAVFDQSMSCTAVKSLTSFNDGSGINRFDIAKALTIWYDNTEQKEFVAVTGMVTDDTTYGVLPSGSWVNTFPQAYISEFELTSIGGLTFQWIRFSDIEIKMHNQFVPSDILIDEVNSRISVVGALGTGWGGNFAYIWSVETDGDGVFQGFFEGDNSGSGHLDLHDLYPQQISIIGSGNYLISGWAPEYYNANSSPPGMDDGKYNYFIAEFDPSDNSAVNAYHFVGNTTQYPGNFGSGIYAADANLTYTDYRSNPQTVSIITLHQYHEQSSLTVWTDNENVDHYAFSWVHIPNTTYPTFHQLRLKSEIYGSSDDEDNCDEITKNWGIMGGEPVMSNLPISPWITESSISALSMTLRSPSSEIPDQSDCTGDYD